MRDSMAKALNLPKGIPTSRYKPRPKIEIPSGMSELPLVDKNHPNDQKIQEVWIARVKVFNLSDEEELGEYTSIWQSICDGAAIMSEHRTEFMPDSGRFVALLRWAELQYKVPSA